MNTQDLTDRFVESPRRWLIVTAATAVVALATVLPQVDQYLAARAEEEEQREQLVEVEFGAQQLPRFRQRVLETTEALEKLDERTLPVERVAEFRSELVELAREAGCQVRRIGVGAVRSRPWREEDHPLADAKAKAGAATPFALETRPVNLSITGSVGEVRNLIGRIEEHGMMMHAQSVDLRPTGRNRNTVQAELELWCFALVRGKRA